TGLHFADVHKLLDVLQRLVSLGNTVIVIEHNLDVIKSADHIIDLGPEGGSQGGRVVASGTPEEVARVRKSHTGQALRPLLNGHAANGHSQPNGKDAKNGGATSKESKNVTANGKATARGRRKDAAGEFVNQFLLKSRRALPALALTTDGGVLTCVANDTGFERVFARQVEAFGAEGDVLLAITTSGNSPNVVAAAEVARARGMKVVGLLGRDGGRVRELCDLALVVESDDTQRIQETHNLVGHVLCDLVEQMLFNEVMRTED